MQCLCPIILIFFQPFVDQPSTVAFLRLCLHVQGLPCGSRLRRNQQPVGQFRVDWHFYYAYSINNFMTRSSRHTIYRWHCSARMASKLKMRRHWILFWIKYEHCLRHFGAQPSTIITLLANSSEHRPKQIRNFPHSSNA